MPLQKAGTGAKTVDMLLECMVVCMTMNWCLHRIAEQTGVSSENTRMRTR